MMTDEIDDEDLRLALGLVLALKEVHGGVARGILTFVQACRRTPAPQGAEARQFNTGTDSFLSLRKI